MPKRSTNVAQRNEEDLAILGSGATSFRLALDTMGTFDRSTHVHQSSDVRPNIRADYTP